MTEQLELFQGMVSLDEIRDPATGSYAVPWPINPWRQLTGLRTDPERWQRTILDPVEREMDRQIACAIVDTGVLTSHPFMRGRLVEARDFTGEGPDDTNGHGTHMALLTAMDIPWMPILSAKVVAAAPVTYEEQVARVARAIDWAVEQQPRILQLAIGRRQPCGDAEAPYVEAVKRALDAGIYVVVAGAAQCPAASDPRIHAVGAEDDGADAAEQAVKSYEYLPVESDFIADLLAGHIAARELGMAPPAQRGAMGYGYGRPV